MIKNKFKKRNKRRKIILSNIALKRYRRRISSKKRKDYKKISIVNHYIQLKKELGGEITYENAFIRFLPPIVSYLIGCEESDFYITKLNKNIPKNNGLFKVPKDFSLIDNPKESFEFLQQLTAVLIDQTYENVVIDYGNCKHVDLGAQVFLDIIIKDILSFYKKCKLLRIPVTVEYIGGINVKEENIQKLLFSVGSPAVHTKQVIKFRDIIPYRLCIHNKDKINKEVKNIEQKDLDTTRLVDYVIDSLKGVNKYLSADTIYELSTIIGEILINAEEHSTTQYRFSIGFFHKMNEEGKNIGVFRLVILNFGNTIYEKFKDEDCLNKEIVKKMNDLSHHYRKNKYFFQKIFEEESLWTLYALQDGVTSLPARRGHGTIQFIDSFLKLRGDENENKFSRMTIMSGNTKITFDGTYDIKYKNIDNDIYGVMALNNSGNIEEEPDKKYVKFAKNYFPGTIISAKILFKED